ncbi:hypothetical protein MP638_002239 [Amoeboaphelidium occidentale]|nr:hypothetical protein MP638_002239 [Amoeboaphelidium occidentale]
MTWMIYLLTLLLPQQVQIILLNYLQMINKKSFTARAMMNLMKY